MSANIYRYGVILETTTDDALPQKWLFSITNLNSSEKKVREYLDFQYPYCKVHMIERLYGDDTAQDLLDNYEHWMYEAEMRSEQLPDEYYHNINTG